MNTEDTAVPAPKEQLKICATCSRHDPQDGYCIFWCTPTESIATCAYWKEEEE